MLSFLGKTWYMEVFSKMGDRDFITLYDLYVTCIKVHSTVDSYNASAGYPSFYIQ